MTPETREELARAAAKASCHPDDADTIWQRVTEWGETAFYYRIADAIAPIIERLVAERVAANLHGNMAALAIGYFAVCCCGYTAIRSATR